MALPSARGSACIVDWAAHALILPSGWRGKPILHHQSWDKEIHVTSPLQLFWHTQGSTAVEHVRRRWTWDVCRESRRCLINYGQRKGFQRWKFTTCWSISAHVWKQLFKIPKKAQIQPLLNTHVVWIWLDGLVWSADRLFGRRSASLIMAAAICSCKCCMNQPFATFVKYYRENCSQGNVCPVCAGVSHPSVGTRRVWWADNNRSSCLMKVKDTMQWQCYL